MSSPTRHLIDPLICSYSEQSEQRPRMSLSSSGNNVPISHNRNSSIAQNGAATSGWTPLVSRTFSNEIGSLNSTPSSKLFASIYRQGSMGDGEFAGLNLTPFLNHNINVMHPLNSAGNGSANGNFTPYYDKSMHMTDFFMDSPIRQTPGKVEAMTPSKFDLSHEAPRLNPALSVKKPASSTHKPKRSITQLDTPNRHASKKSGASVAAQMKVESEYDSDNDVENTGESPKKFDDSHFVTPSKKKSNGKVLRESKKVNVNKTPMKNTASNKDSFQTPAAKCPVSSPSTVIMSSAVKTPGSTLHMTHPLPAHLKVVHPSSPTPNKGPKSGDAPVMGVFSERKLVPPKSGELAEFGPKKPARKQGGNSKFQIVFTDVHTLMNSKKKPIEGGPRLERKKSKNKKKGHVEASAASSFATSSFSEHSQGSTGQFMPTVSPQYMQSTQMLQNPSLAQFAPGSNGVPAYSNPQDYNTSMASQKEFSMMHNSTANSSNPNMTSTDHASFEMIQGGFLSTPNGKFLLDNSFEKPSPNAGHLAPASRFSSMHEHADHYMPPPKGFTLQQAAQVALNQGQSQGQVPHPSQLHTNASFQTQNSQYLLPPSHPPPPNMAGMSMLMSTPQHQSVSRGNYGNFANEESSPSEKDSMKYLYQQLHQYQPGSGLLDVKEVKEEDSSRIEAAGTDSEKTPVGGKKAAKRKPRKR